MNQQSYHHCNGQFMGVNMKRRPLYLIALALLILISACTARSTPPPVDLIGTVAQQLAYEMLTQTAGAPTPTVPPATVTATPASTEPPTLEPTQSGPIKRPVVNNFAGCWYGPGPEYQLDSNISKGKRVEIVGIGSVAGWYIIINPYFHKRCWIEAANLKIDPAMDLSKLPVMTPPP